jgi:hypothetical protein
MKFVNEIFKQKNPKFIASDYLYKKCFDFKNKSVSLNQQRFELDFQH